MENIAPDIIRQRLIIEAFYRSDMDKEKTEKFLVGIAKALDLKAYGDPTVYMTGEAGKNQGYDGFIPLIDSGICVYVWTAKKFMSSVLYTCKEFNPKKAVEFVKEYFDTTERIVWKEF